MAGERVGGIPFQEPSGFPVSLSGLTLSFL